ncbi:MAG TPA: efflux RND transporter permease subunit [Acidiferrobacteraceae bacterium]|nr:efflux RND transporter permease subunit [Acidiferrobacteraceae bacterium]
MNLSRWIQAHRRSILFLMALLALAGALSSFRLPVALFPHVSFPRVEIFLDAGDRPASRMAIEVTYPVEEAVRAIPGVVSVRSKTARGSSEIYVNFHWGQHMIRALLEVQSAISQIRQRLPANTSVQVRRMDPTVFPVIAYSLTSKTTSLVELRNIAKYQLRPLISTIDGVARVGVQGGQDAEYHVTVEPQRLAAYGLTLQQVAQALRDANVLRAVGRLEDHYKLYLAIADTQLHGLKDLRHLAIRTRGGGIVRLDQIARVRRSAVPQWWNVVANGHRAVIFQVYQQPGGNTVALTRAIKRKLAAFLPRLPPGVVVSNWYDQSQLILASAASVRDAVLIGVLLAAAILLLFLRNLRITLIAIVSVPAVLATTILLLFVFGLSFNIMTLGGMAAAVGLIIDDTIVMVEHIIRRLREPGAEQHHRQRVMLAARQFARPLAGSSASTVIIFAPLAFLSGVTGAFFKALSLTMAGSLVISFLIAWLAVPLLADHLLRPQDAQHDSEGALTRRVHAWYGSAMRFTLPRMWMAVLIVVPLVVLGWTGYHFIGSGFMPAMDEGGFVLDYRAPPGTSLTETVRLLHKVERILKRNPAVQTYSLRTGLQLGGGITEANEGDFFVRLKPFPRPPIETVMEQVRSQVEHRVPGLKIEMAQLMEDLIGDLTAVPQPIEVKLYSDNSALLRRAGPAVAHAISGVRGVVDVRNGIVYAGDAVEVQVNAARAAAEGVNPRWIGSQLERYMAGVVATRIQRGVKMIGVRVWIPTRTHAEIQTLRALPLRAPDGHVFLLSTVAHLKVVTGQPEIMRDNLKQMIAVTGRIQGRSLGSVVKNVEQVLKRPGIVPAGMYYSLGGLYRQQRIAFRGLIEVFVAAVALVFLLLLFLYERFGVALAMLGTTLLALAAVFIGLWITHTELNISSMMGMTMVVGIVTEVSIFYYSEFQDLGDDMPLDQRLLQAGMNRMRPIAMTTLAAILALLPLALGIGEGSAMQQPLAVAIIAGLSVQLPLVLLVLPLFLRALRGRSDGTPSATPGP